MEGRAMLLLQILLLLYVLLTILNQFNCLWMHRLNQRYLLGLIPTWTFFAPKPGMHDFRIAYRCFLNDDDCTPLHPVFENFFSRSHLSFVWNPNKRLKKAVFDAGVELAGLIEENSKNNNKYCIELSMPYILILSYISSLPEVKMYCRIQFVVLLSTYTVGQEKLHPLYVSNIHNLD